MSSILLSKIFIISLLLGASLPIQAQYARQSGGMSLALSQAGASSLSDAGAVEINPAMLAYAKSYDMNASYHWPEQGRDFYQMSIIDHKTAGIASGIIYQGYLEDAAESDKIVGASQLPTLKHRFALGFAQRLSGSKVTLGLSGQYLELSPTLSQKKKRGVLLGAGLTAPFGSKFVFGLSYQNFGNSKLNVFQPKRLQAGVSYILSPRTILSVDYRDQKPTSDSLEILDDAKKLIGSMIYRYKKSMKVLLSYGQSTQNSSKRVLGAGIVFENKGASLSYQAFFPTFDKNSKQHQALSLSYGIKI